MPSNDLMPPKEIPWQLIKTQQEQSGERDPKPGTKMSIFSYEPQGQNPDYPDDRIIYFKFSLSITPLAPSNLHNWADWAKVYFQEGLPVKYLLLNIHLDAKKDELKPYFISASPVRRDIIETGVIGIEMYEGESQGIAVGKSNTQIHETVSSQTQRKSSNWGLNLGVLKFGGGSTNAVVDSERNLDQYTETTNRDASQERKELISHTSNIENVISLLSARYVGSPYLQFCLYPRPLSMISSNSSDPDLWYTQYLKYISSGLNGIQEFFAVAIVPKAMDDFRINIRYFSYSILNNTTDTPQIRTEFNINEVYDYLYERFPVGMPIQDIDVDLSSLVHSSLINKEEMLRPVVNDWGIFGMNGTGWQQNLIVGDSILLRYLYLHKTSPSFIFFEWINYKTLDEVKYDMSQYYYEKEISKHPVESGIVFEKESVCSVVVKSATSPSPQPDTDPPPSADSVKILDYYPSLKADNLQRLKNTKPYYERPTSTIDVWNQVNRSLFNIISSIQRPVKEFTTNDPKFLSILIDRWAGLEDDDPRNLPLSSVLSRFNFTPKQSNFFTEKDSLKTLAIYLKEFVLAKRLNDQFSKINRKFENTEKGSLTVIPISCKINESIYRGILNKIATAITVPKLK